jgi:hypothetical protein
MSQSAQSTWPAPMVMDVLAEPTAIYGINSPFSGLMYIGSSYIHCSTFQVQVSGTVSGFRVFRSSCIAILKVPSPNITSFPISMDITVAGKNRHIDNITTVNFIIGSRSLIPSPPNSIRE